MTKIIGVGCMKTGTTTLGACLTHLGYRHQSYYFPVVREFMAGNRQPALDLLAAFDSFDDWPFFVMYREIAELYPDARFILTTRSSPDRWLKSIKSHTMRTDLYVRHLHRHFYGAEYPHNDPQAYLDFYNRHNEEVRAFFGTALIDLCWEKGDGWTEMCAALDKPVPNIPFPHAHPGGRVPIRQAENFVARSLEARELQVYRRRVELDFPSRSA